MDPNQHLGLQCEPSLLVLDEGDKDGFSFYLDNLIQEYIYIYKYINKYFNLSFAFFLY